MISPEQVFSLTVIISRGQSRAPEKRGLETAVLEASNQLAGVRTISIPHLYDLPANSETVKQLQAIDGDIVFVSWVFPRASHWVLDRLGVRGKSGEVLLRRDDDSDEDEADAQRDAEAELENPLPARVLDSREIPDRSIYCLDFRDADQAPAFIDEINRILQNDSGQLFLREAAAITQPDRIEPLRIDEAGGRRWYPVIDYSRCTNCMECIDFCLFGVYGVDGVETILVEQPDNCRKGCPACSRVCPENAIMFPQHKTPAIAGANTDDGTGLKIDLSLLFGAPESNEDPIAAAARERDEQLLLAGRAAVGLEVGIPKRHLEPTDRPKDALDQLIDQLDDLDL